MFIGELFLVRRDSLKRKLEQLGSKVNFLDVVTSIYSSTKVSLSCNSYVPTPFSTSIGLKQGDILSTMFFNLFINDLPMLLENIVHNLKKVKLQNYLTQR